MSYSPNIVSDQQPSNSTADGVAAGTSVRSTITCTASATPHTAGSYVEVDSALAGDVCGIHISFTAVVSTSGSDSSTLLEIATGASGSEVVWATVPVGFTTTTSTGTFFVPGFIASGTRVAVRARGAIASQQVAAVYEFAAVKSTAPGPPQTFGVDTSTSHGVALTAPGATNTKGAWTQITATTGAAMGLLLVRVQANANNNTQASGVLVDIGIGGSGSETVLIGDISYAYQSTEQIIPRSPLTHGVDIPAGSRLSARYARANAANTVDVVLIGA